MTALEQYLEKRGADAGGMVRKAFKSPGSWDKSARSAMFVMTTEEEDRYRDIVRIAGMDLDAFLANPVVLPFHNSRTMPVGQWEDVTKIDKGRPKRIEGRAVFPAEGEMAMADEVAKGIQLGLLRGASIGFMPRQVEDRYEDNGDRKRWLGWDIVESELFECSIVAVPANPRTLVRDLGGDEAQARRVLEETLDIWHRSYDTIFGRSAYEEALKRLGPNRTLSAPVAPPPEDMDEKIAAALASIMSMTEDELHKIADDKVKLEAALTERRADAGREAAAKAEPEVMGEKAPPPRKRTIVEIIRSLAASGGTIAERVKPLVKEQPPEQPAKPAKPAKPLMVKGSRANATARLLALKADVTDLID